MLESHPDRLLVEQEGGARVRPLVHAANVARARQGQGGRREGERLGWGGGGENKTIKGTYEPTCFCSHRVNRSPMGSARHPARLRCVKLV
jgi:hypothetical protein